MSPRARQGALFGSDAPPETDLESLWYAVEQVLAAYASGLTLSRIRISNRMQRTLGSYSPSKREIALSSELFLSGGKKSIWRVLLHEIAHAITLHRHPGSRPHGREFRGVCDEIGADPSRFIDVGLVSPSEPIRYSIQCPSCGGLNKRKRLTRFVRCICGARLRIRRN